VLGEGGAERLGAGGLRRHLVVALAGIAGEVVELRPGSLDVLPAPLADRAQVAPAVVEERQEGLRVGRLFGKRTALQGGRQRTAGEGTAIGRRNAENGENGWEEIDASRGDARSDTRTNAGPPEYQRDAKRRLIDEVPMHVLAVLAQAFAVVRRDDDERVASPAPAVERVEKAPHELVREGDLSVVRPVGVAGRVRLGRLVGVVGIVEVEPREEARRRPLLEPGDRLRGGFVAAPLDRVEEARVVGAQLEPVGVDVEAAVQAGLRGEHDRGDEAGRVEPGGFQDRGHRRDARVERRRDVVAEAVGGGVEPGEDGGVRGPREGDGDGGFREERAVPREAVEMRGRHVGASVGPDPVRA
jgi:hypothetical protein